MMIYMHHLSLLLQNHGAGTPLTTKHETEMVFWHSPAINWVLNPLESFCSNLAAPAILAQIINALYNIVDRMYIGNIEGIGKMALTGVGLTFPIIILIAAFAILVGMGGAPIAAIRMGNTTTKPPRKLLGNCLTMLVFFSLVLTVIFLIFKRPLLYMFGGKRQHH